MSSIMPCHFKLMAIFLKRQFIEIKFGYLLIYINCDIEEHYFRVNYPFIQNIVEICIRIFYNAADK